MSGVSFMYGSFQLLCDEEDFPFIRKHISTVVVRSNGVISYAALNVEGVIHKIHRYLLNPPADLYVDHINGNTLDNRKCNLRLCTNSQNQANARPHVDKESALPKGVTRAKHSKEKPYQVRLSHAGYRISVGYFKTVEEAEAAYKSAQEFYNGEFAFHVSRKESK